MGTFLAPTQLFVMWESSERDKDDTLATCMSENPDNQGPENRLHTVHIYMYICCTDSITTMNPFNTQQINKLE